MDKATNRRIIAALAAHLVASAPARDSMVALMTRAGPRARLLLLLGLNGALLQLASTKGASQIEVAADLSGLLFCNLVTSQEAANMATSGKPSVLLSQAGAPTDGLLDAIAAGAVDLDAVRLGAALVALKVAPSSAFERMGFEASSQWRLCFLVCSHHPFAGLAWLTTNCGILQDVATLFERLSTSMQHLVLLVSRVSSLLPPWQYLLRVISRSTEDASSIGVKVRVSVHHNIVVQA